VNIFDGQNLHFEYIKYNDQSEREFSVEALKNVNVQIKPGEFVAILGHNGSGKSTLAKHLNALLVPSKGTLFVKGIDTKDEKHIMQVRQTVGMVFQNPDNQIVAAVVEEDVAFGPENLGVESSEIRKRVDAALQTVHMEDYSRHAPNLLSGGQKQRVAIAGILAIRPDCIVLDEPTAMLDPVGRKEVLNTVEGLNKNEGITIILVTHFMEEAVRADRVIVMNEGEIVIDDVPKQVFKQVERLKMLGLDVPQVTEIAHNLISRGINLPGDIISIEEMVDSICKLKQKI